MSTVNQVESPSDVAPAAVPHAPESHMDDNNAICPHCLAENYVEAEDYNPHEREVVCDVCEKTFLQFEDFTVTHHTRPLPVSS
jgi:predicted Zn finger-like uncharacterized protein